MTAIRWIVACVFVLACHSHDHAGGDDHEHGDGPAADERPALSFTHWTEQSELFIELSALVVGRESPCAAHVTKLEPSSALAEGRVSVVLRGAGKEERFDAQAPSVPGIFRPVAKPASPGPRRLSVEIRAPGLSADHDLGDVTIYESVEAARAALPEEPEEPGRIPFLKEQQWPIEFATAVIAERSIRPTLRASGLLRARTDGDVVVTAPSAGRVASAAVAFPRPGQRAAIGDVLARLAPRLEAADLASLDLAVTSASLELRFAQRERERLASLSGQGAVPARRVEDATHAEEAARAALDAAQRRLAQFRRVERAGGGDGSVQLSAPLSGTVTAVHVGPGTFVEAGAPLFRVTDMTQLWLEVSVPEADSGKLGEPRGASFSVDGSAELIDLPPEALVARGQVVDPMSRTVPVWFAVDNSSARLPLGAFCRVVLVNGEPESVLAVPEASIVDDGGIPVVFVQVEGEAFERRALRLGARDRGFVAVRSGVQAGEHVVTRGAWSVKLAASSGAVPAHGHSH